MSDVIRFTVDGPPVPKGRPRVYNGVAVTPPRTVAYEEAVGYAALAARTWDAPTDKPVSVVAWFYMPNHRRVDVDNLVKSLLDGLSGVLYEDDGQVVRIEAVKMVDRDNPRAEVCVRELEEHDGYNAC